MTYGFVVTMPAPVELYDDLHQQLLRSTRGAVEGLLLHIGRQVKGGFQVMEVWETREQCDRYNREVVWPLTVQASLDHPPSGEPVIEEFEVRGLVIQAGGVTI